MPTLMPPPRTQRSRAIRTCLSVLLISTMGACGETNSTVEQITPPSSQFIEPPIDTSPVGGDRPANVHIPSDYTAARSWPLVILLHGYSANAQMQDFYLKLSGERVDRHGYLLILPDGTLAPNGNRFWNATDYCCDFYNQEPDDVSYITALIEEAQSRYNIAEGRVYLMGHSNGGFLAYRIACERPDLIAAMMSLAGSTFNDPTRCEPTEPVAILQVHGTNDQTILYSGTHQYPSAEETVERWRQHNNCTAFTNVAAPIDLDASISEAETQIKQARGCRDEFSVELWSIDGGGHIPGFNATFTDRALEHLFQYAK